MKLSKELIEFLKISQRLSGVNLLLTDKEKSILEIDKDANISYEERNITDVLKEMPLKSTVIKNEGEIIPLFKDNQIEITAEIITPIFFQEKQVGFLVYYTKEGFFDEKRIEYSDTAKYFVEKFLEKCN